MPNPYGRPPTFNDSIKNRIRLCAVKGFTDKEICEAVGVPERTLNNWKHRYPEFWQSLKDWKAGADAEIERSLYDRGRGYKHPEDKIFLGPGGDPIIVPTTKHYPPDATSMIFWLKNRQPDKWRDKTETQVSGSVSTVVSLTDADRELLRGALNVLATEIVRKAYEDEK